MEFGCSTLLYGSHSLQDALDGIHRAGFKAIELCAITGMAEHLTAAMLENPDALAQVKELAEKRGLAIESIGASMNLLDDGAPKRVQALSQAASWIGAPALTTGTGGRTGDEASFEAVVAALKRLTPILLDAGVKLSLKPHVGAAMHNTETAIRLMEMVDTRAVGLNVDASHLWRTPVPEVPEETIPRLLPWLVTARIRDTLSHEQPIGPVETQVPGGGAMNLAAVIRVFESKPGLKYVTLEIVGTHSGWELAKVDAVVSDCYRKLEALR